MNISIEEQISALMDGELSATETHHLLNILQQNPELKKLWGNYHLGRAAIHHDLPEKPQQDAARNIINALALEPTILAPRTVTLEARLRSFSPAMRQIAGLAIAASVTAFAILGVQTLPQDPLSNTVPVANFAQSGTQTESATIVSASENAIGSGYSQVAATQDAAPIENMAVAAPGFLAETNPASDPHWNLSEPAFEAKLNTYLNNHNQYSAPADMQGVLPYARMVDYGQEP